MAGRRKTDPRVQYNVNFELEARRTHELECAYESSRQCLWCNILSTTLVSDKNKRTLVKDKSQGLLSATAVSDSCQRLSLCYATLRDTALRYANYAMLAMLRCCPTLCYATPRYATLRYASDASCASSATPPYASYGSYAMLPYATLCCAMVRYAALCYATLYYATLYTAPGQARRI